MKYFYISKLERMIKPNVKGNGFYQQEIWDMIFIGLNCDSES